VVEIMTMPVEGLRALLQSLGVVHEHDASKDALQTMALVACVEPPAATLHRSSSAPAASKKPPAAKRPRQPASRGGGGADEDDSDEDDSTASQGVSSPDSSDDSEAAGGDGKLSRSRSAPSAPTGGGSKLGPVSLLQRIRWRRVILDEAHAIKNRQAATTKAALLLTAERRWCLSGTPLQNRVGDLIALVRFLRTPVYGYNFCKNCPCAWLDRRCVRRRSPRRECRMH